MAAMMHTVFIETSLILHVFFTGFSLLLHSMESNVFNYVN